MSEWQPIESAPKGQAVLIFNSGPPEHANYITSGWYGQRSGEYEDYWHNYCGGPFSFKPTHWMPLPEPPNE